MIEGQVGTEDFASIQSRQSTLDSTESPLFSWRTSKLWQEYTNLDKKEKLIREAISG